MKNLFTVALTLFVLAVHAQKPAPKKTSTTPKTQTGTLKNLNDSASYALGYSVASSFAQQGITNINTTALVKAINDYTSKKQPLINENLVNDVIMKYIDLAQSNKVKPTIAASEKFLAENKKRAGVKTTASGLQYEVITEGKGPKPLATDTVVVNYRGTLIDGTTEFDNSYKRGQPIEFPLNRVIAGWTEGVQLMPVGSKYKFYIPHQLGYGTHGNQGIPGGAALIFEVDLLSIKGK
jgi:FKBP-type peptidyl-prolyl cis-trans isomerase FklB